MPRSGTNFLYNLLMLHPDCAPPDPVWEDFLVAESDHLLKYTEAVAGHWQSGWGADENTRRHLESCLGDGISAFLSQRCNGPQVVTKTPRVDHIEHFFRLFPKSKLLILVRDGRAVVESGVRSFGWNREAAMHSVAEAGAKILDFKNTWRENAQNFRVVRYEDLWLETEPQVRGILRFLDLDDARYDFAQARELPVRGSSDLARNEDPEIHWDPVERSAAFDPISRFAHWSPARHFRYNHVAGAVMDKLGYERQQADSALGTRHLANLLLDAAWPVTSRLRPLHQRLRRR
jgi:hypothetical protein